MKTNPTPKSIESLIEQYNRELMQYAQQHADHLSPKEPSPSPPATSAYADQTVDDLLANEFPLPEPYPPAGEAPASKSFSYSEAETPLSPPTAAPEEEPTPCTVPLDAIPRTMSVGYLQIQASSAREAVPIPGVLITVSRETEEGEELYIHTITDRDGLTAVYPLPAVDSALTLEPGIPSPYTSYNIQAYAPGFFRVFNVNAPIYGGNTAIQPIQMIPIPEFDLSPQDLVFFQTGPQDL